MLKRFVVIFLALSSAVAEAGDKVGNGGGLWTCSTGTQLQQAVLVDLYEAEEEFGLNIITSFESDPMKIVQERSDFIRTSLPEYSPAWNRILSESAAKIRLVNSELVVVDDALFRITPPKSTCTSGWVYAQFANFTYQDQILVRADLWNSSHVPTLHKAALIWHEVIYKWLREAHGDLDSVRTRQVVGLLFSTLPIYEIRTRLQQLLGTGAPTPPPANPPPAPVPDPTPSWICMGYSSHTSTYYADLGFSRLQAETKTKQKCEQAQDPFFCPSSLTCEQIQQSQPVFACKIENSHISKTYLGEGRSRLEAEFNARAACQKGPKKFFCSAHVICD